MLNAWLSKAGARNGTLALFALIATASVSSAAVIPWAPSGSTVWVPATAAIGIDPPPIQSWGPAITYSLVSGSSFSTVPYVPSNNTKPLARTYSAGTVTLASTSSYMGSANWNTANVGGSYPAGIDNNPPNIGGSIQPAGSAPMNINKNVFAVATTVVSNSGQSGYPQTDPYPVGPKLNIQNPATTFNPGTNAAIIAGTYANDGTGNPITVQWRTRSQNEILKGSSYNQNLPVAAAYLASDIMQMSGQLPGTDFVLQMDFSNEVETPGDQFYDIQANKALYLGMLVNQNGITTWANAVSSNVSNTVFSTAIDPITHRRTTISEVLPATGKYAWHPSSGNWVASTKPSDRPYVGSFQSFLNSTYVEGGNTHYFYEHSLDELRGTWGVDTSTDTAWAVLDVGNGIFAVVPEPASIRLVTAGLLSLAVGFWWRRRARIMAAKAKKLSVVSEANSTARFSAAA